MTSEQYNRERDALRAQRSDLVDAATKMARDCAGRAFTVGEEVDALHLKRRVDQIDQQVTELDAARGRAKATDEQTHADGKATDEQTKAAMRDLFGGLGGLDDHGSTPEWAGGGPSQGWSADQPRTAAADPSEKAAAPAWARSPVLSPWVKAAMGRIDKVATATGGKALVSGSLDVPTPVDPELTRMAAYPTRVLDLLIDRRAITGTNTFNYPRQTVRTNNAAPVADGATKPVSVFTVTDVEDRVRVIAHLSENIPERVLADHGELADFLQIEMELGLLRTLEAQVVSGSGVGENMTGVLSTSGILTQAFATNLHTTLRKARTAMAVTGEIPTAWLLNPADTEAIDLLREGTEGAFLLANPPTNILGGLPVVESTAVAAGTALLADWRWARLMVREDTKLDLDRSGALFETNQVRFRLEGRFGLAVRRTTAFCRATLTGP